MNADVPANYLAGLAEDQHETLERANSRGLADLREYLKAGNAVAFLGAGASAPLYRLWPRTIAALVAAASDVLSQDEERSCHELADDHPDCVVDFIRNRLGTAEFQATLFSLFGPRADEETGKTWTLIHELVARSNFKGVVTTNYDPGIVEARAAVRPKAVTTGFWSYTNNHAMDRWRTGDIFTDAELPILYAHGRYDEPDAIVLAATEYRSAYASKLAAVLGQLVDTGHLVWIGFSFADPRITAILRAITEESGSRIDPGRSPRHIAIMPWNPVTDSKARLDILRSVTNEYGARLVWYPAPDGNHSALARLLEDLADPELAAVPDLLPTAGSEHPDTAVVPQSGLSPDGTDRQPIDVTPAIPHVLSSGEPIQAVATVTMKITIDQSAWRGAHAESRVNVALWESEARHSLQHRLIQAYANVRARQQIISQSLASLSDATRDLEMLTSRRQQEYAAAFWSALQKDAPRIGGDTRRALDQQAIRWRSAFANERMKREQDYREIYQTIEQRRDDEPSQWAARNLMSDARILADTIARNLPHERFAAGRLAGLQQRLAWAEASSAASGAESALGQDQQLCLQLGELMAEVEIRDQEWRMAQAVAESAVTVLLEQISLNATLNVTDENGRSIDGVTLDVDFWSEGELSEIFGEAEALLATTSAESDPPTLPELRATAEQDVPALDGWLTEIVNRAGARQFASQVRINLAELVAQTLEDALGFTLVDGQSTYAGGDQRRAFCCRLHGGDEEEFLVEVEPDADGQACLLGITSDDTRTGDSADRRRRAQIIADRLRVGGFPVESPAEQVRRN